MLPQLPSYIKLRITLPQYNPQPSQLDLSQRIQKFQKDHDWIAYIYASISSISLALLQVNIKIVSSYINPMHALGIRGILMFSINYMFIYYYELTFNIREKSIFITILKRVFWGNLTLCFLLLPLKYIPAGTASALYNTAPIMIYFVETLKYRKLPNTKQFILTLASFIGIIMVIQPSFLFGQTNISYQKYLMFLSLAAAVTNSISMSYLYDLKGKMSPLIATHYFYLSQCLFNNIAIMFQQINYSEVQLDFKFYICMFGMVVFAFGLQNFNTRATLIKKPSHIMPFGYITVIVASFIDYKYFGTTFNTISIVGMFLTSCGLLMKLFVPENEQITISKLATEQEDLNQVRSIQIPKN